jgi:D-glycero-alpha-D-manno-heptose-7-phosphate kinase
MIIARAPVRISFGGGGTDLEAYYTDHSGLVLSTTISRYCTVLAREAADGRIRVTSSDYAVSETFEPGVMPAVEETLALPKAALEWFITRGLCPNGVELVLSADVPPGTGLGSSSAMAVALVRALATATGVPIDSTELAELACDLEIGRLGMPIGKQDQYASAFGGLNTFEFSSQGVQVQPLDLPPALLAALDARLMLFSTGRTRAASSILRQQQADTRTSGAVLEALHQIKALAMQCVMRCATRTWIYSASCLTRAGDKSASSRTTSPRRRLTAVTRRRARQALWAARSLARAAVASC